MISSGVLFVFVFVFVGMLMLGSGVTGKLGAELFKLLSDGDKLGGVLFDRGVEFVKPFDEFHADLFCSSFLRLLRLVGLAVFFFV